MVVSILEYHSFILRSIHQKEARPPNGVKWYGIGNTAYRSGSVYLNWDRGSIGWSIADRFEQYTPTATKWILRGLGRNCLGSKTVPRTPSLTTSTSSKYSSPQNLIQDSAKCIGYFGEIPPPLSSPRSGGSDRYPNSFQMPFHSGFQYFEDCLSFM